MEMYQNRSKTHRRISKARRKAFQRKKTDTTFEIFHPLVFFVGLFAYLEFVFHVGVFGFQLIFYPIWLPICVAALFAIVSSVSRSELANKIIALVLTSLMCILFVSEVVYNAVFMDTFFQLFSIFSAAGQALDFVDLIAEQIWKHIFLILFLLAPIPLLATIGWRKLSFRPKEAVFYGGYFGVGIIAYLLGLLFLLIGGKEEYSAYQVYHYNNSVNDEVEKLGIITTNRLDLYKILFGNANLLPDDPFELPTLPDGPGIFPTSPSETSPVTDEIPTFEYVPATDENGETEEPKETQPEGPVIDTSPNILNIDFDAFNASTNDETIKMMNSYFQTQPYTLKNEYTGMFKGYNVIVICAEGFWKYAVDPERTPTLYKLSHEGFVFNHYYTPLWYGSTNGGEYATLSGTLPVNGGYISLQETGKRGTNMYMTLSSQLLRLGYKTLAAHNNTATYYGRNLSLPNMGYSEYFAIGTGYEPELSKSGKNKWPQSDDRLIEQLLPKYVGNEPFHNYIMTVSGHCNYTKTGNSMAAKNWSLVENLPYQLEESKGYIACHYELEHALERLIQGLEEQGIADRTLIVLTGDHVPYNDKEVCDELAGHVLDEGVEWYESTLIMWTASMKEPVIVDKYCSQIDILPTVSNLLGLEYDSRMLVGQDILSTSSQLVIFKNKSFITDRCIYNGVTKQVTLLTDQPVDEEYLTAYRKYIQAKWSISQMLIDNDYYKYLEPFIR